MIARMQNKRLWLGGGAFVAVLIVALGWFFAINPQLSAASTTREQTDSARSQNVVLQAKNNKLKVQNDNVAELRASLAAALAQLPSDGGLPTFTRQLSAQATATSVALLSVTVGGATAVAAAAAAAPATAEGGTTTTAAAAPVAATGVVEIPITVSASGLCSDDLLFLSAIQVDGPRRALVTASQLAPSGSNGDGMAGSCTLALTFTIFSEPLSATAQAALAKLISGK